jgi:hypothetical protein
MQNAMNAGDTVTKDFGPHTGRTILQVRIDRHHDGVSFTVTHHPALNRGFTNLDQARTYLELLRDMAKAGEQVWKIEAAAGVLTSTQAVFDDAEQALIDTLNADFDARDRKAVAEREALEADVAAVMATSTGFCGNRTSTAAPTSDPMDRILTEAAQAGGRIVRSREATSTQLIALRKRGLVELVYGRRGNQRVITGARLTGKGIKHAAVAA